MGCACSADVNQSSHQVQRREHWDAVVVGDDASKQTTSNHRKHRQIPPVSTSPRRDSNDDDVLITLMPTGVNPLDANLEPSAARHSPETNVVDAEGGDDSWMPSGSSRKTTAARTTTPRRHLCSSGVHQQQQQPQTSSFSASACDASRGRAHRPGSCSVWPGQFGSSAAGVSSFSAMEVSNPALGSKNAAPAPAPQAVKSGHHTSRQDNDSGSPPAGLCLFAPLQASPGAGGPAQTPYLSAGTPASTLTPAVVCAASTVRTTTAPPAAAGPTKNSGWPAAAHTAGFMVTIVADTPPPASLLFKGGYSSCYGGPEDAGEITIVLPPPAATSDVALATIQTIEPANFTTATSANDDDAAVATSTPGRQQQHPTSDVSPGTSSHHRRQKSIRSQLVTTARRSAVVDFYNARLEESMMLSNGVTSSESLQREFGSLMASDRSLVLGSNYVSGACAGAKSRSSSNNPTNPSIATSVSTTSAAVGRPIQVSATSLYGRSFSSGLSILNGFVVSTNQPALPAAAGLPPKAPRGTSAGSSKHPSPSTAGRRRRAVASTPLLPEAAKHVDDLIDALFAVPCIISPSRPM